MVTVGETGADRLDRRFSSEARGRTRKTQWTSRTALRSRWRRFESCRGRKNLPASGKQAVLPTGERDVGDTTRSTDSLDIKSFFHSLESVPESFPAPQDYGNDHNVHVIDQVCGEKLNELSKVLHRCARQAHPQLPGRSSERRWARLR